MKREEALEIARKVVESGDCAFSVREALRTLADEVDPPKVWTVSGTHIYDPSGLHAGYFSSRVLAKEYAAWKNGEPPVVTSDTSDGYHTFAELYHQRAVLFAALINGRGEAWKSKQHFDGTMFEGGYFIVGVETPQGQYTYHYKVDPYWEMFDVREIISAPEWDGHTADDVTRLLSIGGGE